MSEAAATGARRAPTRSWPDRLGSPLRDRRGRLSPLKSAVFVLLWLPAIVLAWRYASDDLGARPVLALVHGAGVWALRLLLITLALTPARFLLDWPQSGLIRRMTGVAAASYAIAHFGLYIAQQNVHLLHVGGEILHRFYLTIGFIALVALVALAATSTDGSMRRLGRNWKRLHRLAYAIAVLGLLHYFLQAKAEVMDAVVLAGLFVWLMAWRLLPPERRATLVAACALGLAATLATAGIEVAWYGLATHVNTERIFAANFQLLHWRPSAYVAAYSLAAAGVIAAGKLWRILRRRDPALARDLAKGAASPR